MAQHPPARQRARSRLRDAACRGLLAALALLAGGALPVSAETWIVQPGDGGASWAHALRRAGDGDTIALMPGEYRGLGAVLDGRRLTLRGVGKRPVLVAEGRVPENKAILVLRNADVTVDNLEFRGARAPDANGAGIRFESGRLTVRKSVFLDNENGILTANDGKAVLVVEDSEFGRAPRIEGGLHHLLYVGRIASFSIRGSRFHSGHEGHLIKSRARENRITYNLIYDGENGRASYEIDLPNGGLAWIVGNVIGQGPETQNPVMVAYGGEGRGWERNALYVAHNTFVGSQWPPSWFLRVFDDRLPAPPEVRAVNNLLVGIGAFSPGTEGDFAGNEWVLRRRALQSVYTLEFAPVRESPVRGRGVDPGSGGGVSLAPTAEFTLPVGTRAIEKPSAWTPGAFQP